MGGDRLITGHPKLRIRSPGHKHRYQRHIRLRSYYRSLDRREQGRVGASWSRIIRMRQRLKRHLPFIHTRFHSGEESPGILPWQQPAIQSRLRYRRHYIHLRRISLATTQGLQRQRTLLHRVHKLVRSKLAQFIPHPVDNWIGVIGYRLRSIPRRHRRPEIKPKHPPVSN